jgi:transposase
VIDMDLLSVIRRWHFRQGIPIREIKRRTGLSRNTIRKYLRADAVEPVFRVPDRPSKLDPFAEKLTGWLKVESGKSRKQKRTAKQLYADLVALGYDGSYTRVAAFARGWKRDRQYEQQTSGRGTFVPLVFQPGEAFQFDWSEDYAVLGGKQVKLQVAHTKLSHSRAFIVRAYLLQTHEMLFDALTQAFRVLGGVPQRGIFDNMKTAVDKIGRGKARQVNARFAALASHYLFETDFCNPASGWEKGKSRRTFRMPATACGNLCPASRILRLSTPGSRQCVAQWADIQHGCCPAPSPMCTPKRWPA